MDSPSRHDSWATAPSRNVQWAITGIVILAFFCLFAGCQGTAEPPTSSQNSSGLSDGPIESMTESSRVDDSQTTFESAARGEPATLSVDTTPTAGDYPVRLVSRHIPNPVRLHPKVVSGGLPEGNAAFEELRDLGITTIISVDGARPDVETAKSFGLKYIHLPHGYNGIPAERAAELARCVQLAAGPVYIHCHHGKHRSPAAATVACVGAGMLNPDLALRVLELAGTNPHYEGLFQAAEDARPLEQALLDQLSTSYPETAELPPLAEAMVDLGHALDHLKTLQKNNWQPIETHPDISPLHEALILTEIYRELNRNQKGDWPSDSQFAQLMGSAESSAETLYQLMAIAKNESKSVSREAWDLQLKQINNQCQACHVLYRDVPLIPSESAQK